MPFKIDASWRMNASEILQNEPNKDIIVKILFAVLGQIERNNWKGACHATCGVIHVLLTEEGVENNLILGEAKIEGAFFNHSWIEINGEIYDIAIGNTLIDGFESAPVLKGFDVNKKQPTKVQYGLNSGLGDDLPTEFVKSQSLGSYFDKFPAHPTLGLWISVLDAGMQIGKKYDIGKLKEKYNSVIWSVK